MPPWPVKLELSRIVRLLGIDEAGDGQADRQRLVAEALFEQRLRGGDRLGRIGGRLARCVRPSSCPRRRQPARLHAAGADRQADDVANGRIDLQRNARPTGADDFAGALADDAVVEQRGDVDADRVGVHAGLAVQLPAAQPSAAPEQPEDLALAGVEFDRPAAVAIPIFRPFQPIHPILRFAKSYDSNLIASTDALDPLRARRCRFLRRIAAFLQHRDVRRTLCGVITSGAAPRRCRCRSS